VGTWDAGLFRPRRAQDPLDNSGPARLFGKRMPDAARARFSPSTAAWITLAFLSGLNMLNYLDRYVMSAVLPSLQTELKLDDASGGLVASAFMLGFFTSAPFFGYLGDRFPRRYLMLAGVVVWSLATACSGLAQNFWQLYAIRLFVGFGEACFVTLGPSWISDLFAGPRRNTALTLFYVAISFGSAIGFTIGGWFASHGDWRGAFIYTGLPGLLLALCLLGLREPRRGEADGIAAQEVPALPKVREIFGLLRNGRYHLVVWGYTAQTFAIGAFGVWGVVFLERVHGMAPGTASTLFGIILAGSGLVATLTGGLVATRLRHSTPAGYAWVMAFALLAALPVCCFALTTDGTTAALAGLGVSMFFLFLPTGPITSQLLEIVPVHLRASGVALCTFIMHLFGDWQSPTIVGAISDSVTQKTHNAAAGLQIGVLILPLILAIGAGLWCALVSRARWGIPVQP
jgi:MFS family permease